MIIVEVLTALSLSGSLYVVKKTHVNVQDLILAFYSW